MDLGRHFPLQPWAKLWLSLLSGSGYAKGVIAIEILRKEVAKLPLEERAEFAAFVLETLPPPDYDVSDEEVRRRWEEMESGAEPGINSSEFWRRMNARRNQSQDQ